jgi:hypothetical protein
MRAVRAAQLGFIQALGQIKGALNAIDIASRQKRPPALQLASPIPELLFIFLPPTVIFRSAALRRWRVFCHHAAARRRC